MEPATATATATNKIVNRDEITDAFTDSDQIPEKYIRTDELHDGVVIGEDDDAYCELPVVDMARLLDPELSASETLKLGSACRNWGFFQVRKQKHAYCLHVRIYFRVYLRELVSGDNKLQ